ncbi:putative chaperone DNAJ protein [Trypanosoma rangeli]|uniref:Putative chaperone DNAJ protein n=1 Tax=Trypanosoma rangeli TaxID=5698 RepID=A0A422P3X6_TRYRA|nr:putative chaperone DNAJ protein [Trypanosoma rangeli]RNF12437.1 putative chaperone DNAJ protein [Trypanosoma rangeli]|eukprot:RNF12437.1 putative chaperone DNAJ protein [Trypanosoma rangeli]
MRRQQQFLLARLLLVVVLVVATAALLFLPTPAQARLFGSVDSNDLYGRLGVARGSTKEEIKRAFRKLAREHHPDMQETYEAKEAAKEHMVQLLQAYKVLSDDIQRQDYDNFGAVPGEKFDTAEFSTQQIFEYFHQQSPILSKSQQLESLRTAQRILNFRGNRLFLLQVYDDTCNSCRWFASNWEGLTKSSLVEGGVVEMLRIDAYSMEGPSLLKALDLSYNGEVGVYAFIDGKAWTMLQIKDAVKSRSRTSAFTALLDFVMNFFYDRYTEINSLKVSNGTEAILEWLQEERGTADTLRVLLPPLTVESVALTLSYVYEGMAVVRSVPRAALQDFVENYCEQPIEARNRDGELVPMPEFIVVSSHRLAKAGGVASVEKSHFMRNCSGVSIGVSAALSYRKANAFVRESLPPRHPGMADVTYVTSNSLYEVCRRHCLLWLRESCVEPPSDVWKNVLAGDYKPFAVGYVCLDSESSLRDVLPTSAHDTLVAIMDGDENNLHFLLPDSNPSQIAESLSRLLTGGEQADTPLHLATPLSRLMNSRPFYLSHVQYLYIKFRWVFSVIYSFLSNSYPFLMMFIMHKVLNRFGLLGNETANTATTGSNGNSNGEAAASTAPKATAETGGCSHSDANRMAKNEKQLLSFTAADLEAAKVGKGFLLLLFHPGGEGLPALPSLAEDLRFAVRLASPTDPILAPWLSQHHQEEAHDFKGEDASTEEEDLIVVAIRQGRMKATIKPPKAAIDTWLHDLVDGTITATTPFP